jgi:uncharacterized membrane protein YeaQ/YmgE (transglycosylase-associated protein family)
MEDLKSLLNFDTPEQIGVALLCCIGIMGVFVYFPLRAFARQLHAWQRVLSLLLAVIGAAGFVLAVMHATEYEPANNILKTEAFTWFSVAGIVTLLVGAVFSRIKPRNGAKP